MLSSRLKRREVVLETGKPIAEVARDLAINEGTLGNWVNRWRRDHPEPEPEITPTGRARVAEMEDEIRRLRIENEYAGESSGLLRPGAGLSEKSALIEAEKATHPIAWMCRMLGVPRSSFYAWRDQARGETATQARRRELTEQVRRVFDQQRQTAGCRRVAAQLNAEGYPCSAGLVADIMRELGLRAVQPRAYKTTTVPGADQPPTPDLIERDFAAVEPGTRLCGDITYLRTDQGWLYLATVIDLATRMVIGWQMADHMRTDLVTDALEMARIHGHLKSGAVMHSDRGAQYTSAGCATYCRCIGVRPSMGRTGVCWDKAAAESFFATLKNEMYHRYRFTTRARARFAVAEYIEVFYNSRQAAQHPGLPDPGRGAGRAPGPGQRRPHQRSRLTIETNRERVQNP